jgi:outer membrane protein
MRTTFVALSIMLYLICAAPAFGQLLTLPEGLKMAVKQNTRVDIAREEENIYRAESLIARSKMLPELNGSLSQTFLAHRPEAVFGTFTGPSGSESVPISEKDFISYSLTVQQTLYDFRENAAHYESSLKILDTKKMDIERIRNLVALDFSVAYFDLLEAEKRVIVAEEEVNRLELHLKDARSLYDAGVITRNDLLQAEVRISDAKQRLLTSRSGKVMAVTRLNNILGKPLKEDTRIMDVKERPPGMSGIIMGLDAAWSLAEKNRPEIRIVNELMEAMDLERISKNAGYYPRFYVQGGYEFTENRYQVHEGNWSAILGMRINLYNGGKTTAEVFKAERERMKLLEQKSKLVDDIRVEVQGYLLDSVTALERVAVTENAIESAEENLRINRTKYEEGVGTASDVLDAVTLLTSAETNYYQAVYDLRRAEAGVLYATGTDLVTAYAQ